MNYKTTAKYIAESVAGMIGISVYILADTFFISMGFGSDGLAVLNMTLPLYGLVYAIGSMIGTGSSTVYNLKHSMGHDTSGCFMQSITWSLIFSIPFVISGAFFPKQILALMGADMKLRTLGKGYVQIILTASPLFMCNYSFTGFCRNDHAPVTAMLGSIAGSIFNIIFDYIFMFTLGLGFSGAALATACCPAVTMLICGTHFLGKNNHVPFSVTKLSPGFLKKASTLGMSGFVGEISNGITSLVFNYLMLGLGGNTAVAAYGVTANIALVCTSIFNGIAQGIQPLISSSFGKGKYGTVRKLLRTGLLTAFTAAVIFVAAGYLETDRLVNIFNSEHNAVLTEMASTGIRLYFPGFLVSGINISLLSYFSSIDRGAVVVTGSLLRGLILNTFFAFFLSKLFRMTGIWISYPAAEIVTLAVILIMNRLIIKRFTDFKR